MVEFTKITGLPVALANAHEALTVDWGEYRRQVDVVRVVDPPPEHWLALAEAGFWPKPSWLTWVTASHASENDFLATLSRKERQSIAVALKCAASNGLRTEVRALDEPFMDEFLKLYEARVAEMRHGFPVARMQRDEIVADAERYFVISVWNGDKLVGGCLSHLLREADLVRIRFSAVDENGRRDSLARVIYLSAIRVARELGYRQVSLGNDPNLYGHLVKPGLFGFKSRLGFRPVPSQTIYPHAGDNNADRLLGFNVLNDPAMHLSYVWNTANPEEEVGNLNLSLEVFSGQENIEASRYAAGFTGQVRRHHVL